MPSPVLRKSLLALAIAATLPALATADVACPSGGQCSVSGAHDRVSVAGDVIIGGSDNGISLNSFSSVTTLDNSGSVQGSSYGFHGYRSTITTLNNSGIFGGSSGMAFEKSTLTSLNNSGTISASGSFGIWILDSNATPTTLDNSGSISGGHRGIYLLRLGAAMTINHNAGALSGTLYAIDAIDAEQAITLNWNGGTISGALRGLKTFNLNLDHASLNNSLTMVDGSTIRMRLTADNSQPVLDLGGGIYNLGSGSQILLRPSASNFSVNSQTYTLIQGESGTATSLSVLSESPYLTVHSYNAGAYNITATVSIAAEPQIQRAGGSPNAQRAGSAITPLLTAMAAANSDDPLLDALSGSAAVRTSEQLAPEVNGAALQGANGLLGLTGLNAGQRTQGLRGLSSGEALAESGLWLKALGSEAEQERRDGIEGFDADLSGIALGADTKLGDQTTLGLAYSYLNSDITADGGNQTEIDGHALTLYSGYEQGAWFLDSSLTLGLDHNDSTRYIAGTTAKSDYDSQLLGLNLIGGYGFALDNGVLLEPRAAARYARVDIDSHREKGSLAALDVGSQRYEVAELGAGLRLAGDLPLGQGNLQPQLTLMAYHDFAADRIANSASFVFGGSPFLAVGATPARTRYEAGIGTDYRLDALTFGVSYDYAGKEDFHADTLQAKVRYDF